MIKAFIKAARLRTLPLSISGIIVASALAAMQNAFRWDIFILSLLTTIGFQVLSNYANDYGDGVKGTDNDNRIGPERALQSGEITPSQMKKAIQITALLSFALALGLIFISFDSSELYYVLLFLFLGALSIWAAIRYTVGDDAYGYSGLGDIFVFVFFGLVAVLGGYFLYDHQWIPSFILPAASIGFLSSAVLNLNNMRDMESDHLSNKRTLVVKLGLPMAKRYHFFLILSPLVLSVGFNILNDLNAWHNYIYLIAFIPLGMHLLKVFNTKDSRAFDPELKKVALSTFFYAILFTLSLLW